MLLPENIRCFCGRYLDACFGNRLTNAPAIRANPNARQLRFDCLSPSITFTPSASNSGLRWSIAGAHYAQDSVKHARPRNLREAAPAG
jgi:hypothetical protein